MTENLLVLVRSILRDNKTAGLPRAVEAVTKSILEHLHKYPTVKISLYQVFMTE